MYNKIKHEDHINHMSMHITHLYTHIYSKGAVFSANNNLRSLQNAVTGLHINFLSYTTC